MNQLNVMRELNFLDGLDYVSYFNDARVIKEANEIADKTAQRDLRRNRDQIYNDSLNGLALQYAVFDNMLKRGYPVSPAVVRYYDLILHKDILIDVKGIFKKNARHWGQTDWEHSKVEAHKHVWYLCFDCTDGVAFYQGFADKGDFNLKPRKNGFGSFWGVDASELYQSEVDIAI